MERIGVQSKKTSNGFTLIELSLVMAILTIIAAILLKQQVQEARMLTATAQGQQLAKIRAGLKEYGTHYFTEIANNQNVPGVAVTRAPTVAELSALNLIPGGLSNTAYYGANYVATAVPSPVGCVMPNCNVIAEVHLTSPVTDLSNTAVDAPAIGQIMKIVGSDAGASLDTPGTISGMNGSWATPNPVGAVSGIVMARVAITTQMDVNAYLRRDGSNDMQAALDMGDRSIGGVAIKTAGNPCTNAGELASDALGALLSCQGGTYQPQGSAFWKDPVPAAASLPTCNAAASGQTRVVMVPSVGSGPRAYTCNGAAWAALGTDNSGNYNVDGLFTSSTIQLNTVSTEYAACSPNGLVSRTSTGQLLSCQSGTWKVAGEYSHWKGHYMTLTGSCWIGNPFTGGCSCPAGYAASPSFTIAVNGCQPCISYNCRKL